MSWNSGYIIKIADRTHPLTQKSIRIGREVPGKSSDEENILLPDQSVSRHHATLKWQTLKRCYLLVHESKTNPTLVNGEPTSRILLAPGDKIRVGDSILTISSPQKESHKKSKQRSLEQQLHEIMLKTSSEPPEREERPEEKTPLPPPLQSPVEKPGFKWTPPEERG